MATKHDRIAADLRAQIEMGRLMPGQKLHAEDELVRLYGVSRNTLRQALGALEREGLIVRKHGTGTFVREIRQKVRRTTGRYQWEKDRAVQPREVRAATGATERDTGLVMSDLDFTVAYADVPAPDDLAVLFQVEVGAPLLRRNYTTQKRGEWAPLSYVVSYLDYAVASKNPDLLQSENEPWPGGTQHQLLTVGIELDRIVDIISARPPTAQEVDVLDLPAGVAVMNMRKVSISTSNQVVEVSDIIHPGDRVELEYTTALAPWTEAARTAAMKEGKQG